MHSVELIEHVMTSQHDLPIRRQNAHIVLPIEIVVICLEKLCRPYDTSGICLIGKMQHMFCVILPTMCQFANFLGKMERWPEFLGDISICVRAFCLCSILCTEFR
jgi:hypothetical protein